jgi:uncharacterized protein YecE (DUF72 family)
VSSIGVAGWDYPDWNGIVYPAGVTSRFDRLAWLARFVDVVEINSTFYRPASPAAAASWARRVADRPGFRFTAKAHRSWTHEDWDDPSEVVPKTLAGLAPLRDAGVLGALLIQYPQSFHCTPENLDRLERLLEAAAGWPVVVEPRHVSWDDDRAAAWLREHGAGFCVVAQPLIGRSTIGARARVTAAVAYLRLHGRNAGAWFDPAAGRDERYDYLYSLGELRPLAESARAMALQANALYAIANNHFRGQALANALQLKHLILGIEPDAPAELVAEYPELSTMVAAKGGRLIG